MITRRELAQGFGVTAVAAASKCDAVASWFTTNEMGDNQPAKMLPAEVAGVRLVDSKICREAAELAREVSPPFLFNHAARTYLFGALTGRAAGQRFDEEVLYLACVLHDLGLTSRFAGDLPFEIQGAQAASAFLEQRGYPSAKSNLVWDGIAMHPLAIGQYKQPEISLVGAGAGADVVGADPKEIKPAEVEAVLKAFPRLGFKTAFIHTCAEIVKQHPRGASRSFMRDIGEREVPDFAPRNICDAIAKAPFDE